MSSVEGPRQLRFDATPEIHATDSGGAFNYPLAVEGESYLGTEGFEEIRFVFSLWHPSGNRTIDLDRAYAEVRASFQPDDEHWTRIAEVEPVVPPYSAGDSFDGWLALPVLGSTTAFLLVGSGFEPRARLQIRASAYLVP